ncbi:helix-turn-helix domain-containing protein [Rhizobium leguminosarum]|uniref:helix-turn-helix domain-containing protein n=1 Tax=Rhizobium leguminosarum TaxID=384 RepID=UPI001040A21C|nr:helix-turn-helix domain-containing protein [Rhizobium leguminosarum]TBZ75879.1 helix-turn-helix domain-containing protein [Rhizobium leguminosarum bv. viciae]
MVIAMGEISKNYFAPIPGRANRDGRLSGLHFRVLATIAGHDRMSRNGQCCWAGRNTLAELVGCHPSRLSTSISDLIEWGYLEEQRHREDGRKKGYRVVYEAALDAAGMGCKVTETRLRSGNLSEGNRLPDRNKGHASDCDISTHFQSLESFAPKRNILGRNQNITQKHLGEEPRRARKGQQQLTNILVERLGYGDVGVGWQVYGNLTEEERQWLERLQYRGELANEDVIRARLGSATHSNDRETAGVVARVLPGGEVKAGGAAAQAARLIMHRRYRAFS